MLRIILAVVLLLTRIILPAQNAGVLDNGFGTNGVVTTTLTAGQQNGIHQLLQQPDGKIIAIGNTNHYQSNSEIVVARYNTNGSLDNSFGTGGIAIHSPGSNDNAQSGILQADGKIIVVGIKDYNSGSRAIVMRLNSNGSIDNTFDGDGVMEIGPSTGADNRFVDIETDASGNYFLCGQFDNGAGKLDVAVVKLNPSLAIDNTYGNLGIAQFSTGSGNDNYPGGISIQADGKVVGAGYTAISSIREPLVWRMTTSGALDNSFAGTGWFHYSFSGFRYFTDVAIQSTGRIIAAGYEYFGGNPRVFCTAFNTNGGEVPINVMNNPSQFTVILKITMQSDDRFLLSGYNIGLRNFYLARHDMNGTKEDINPDPLNLQLDGETFGASVSEYSSACLVQSDGKYLLGGYTGSGIIYESGSLHFGLVRYAGLTADVSLPVRLLSFMAEKNSGQVRLSWKTGWEENADRFVVERSASGNAFTSIGSISAGGGSSSSNYSFTDLSPLSTGFYRLKILDKDGQFAYSNIIAIKTNDDTRKMTVFPNPVTDYLYIQSGGSKGPACLSVIDALGRLVKKEQHLLTGNNAFSIDLRSLPKGHYYIVIDCGSSKEIAVCNKY